jgi:hypothetical protein
MMSVHLFHHTKNYDLGAVQEAATKRTAWAEQIRHKFEEVLRSRPVTVKWYREHANDDLRDEETHYRYLQEACD